MKRFILHALTAVSVLLTSAFAASADNIYPLFKNAIMTGTSVNLTTCDVRSILIDDTDYTYSAAHDFLDDIPAGARVATSGSLTTPTVTGSTFDSDDVTFTAVPVGDAADSIVLYCHSGTEATSRLILHLDSTNQAGLPVSPNGGNITYTVDAAGWFTM